MGADGLAQLLHHGFHRRLADLLDQGGGLAEVQQHDGERGVLLQRPAQVGEQHVNIGGALEQARLLVGDGQGLHQAAQAGVVDRQHHLVGNGLQHHHVGLPPHVAGGALLQDHHAHVLFAVHKRNGQDRLDAQGGDELLDGSQLGSIGSVGDGDQAVGHGQPLQHPDELDDGHHVGLLDAGGAVLQGGRRGLAGGAQPGHAAAGAPVAAHVVDGGKEHAFHVALAVDVAGDLGDFGDVVHRLLVGHRLGQRRGALGSRRRRRGPGRGRGSGGRSRGSGRHTGIVVEGAQLLVALILAGEELLDALQALHRARAHGVLEKDLRLQHQVFQHGGLALGFGAGCGGRLFAGLDDRAEAVGDGVEAVGIDLAAQHLQALLVAALVGIDFGGAVETVAGLEEVAGGVVELEEPEQGVAIVVLAVGGVEQADHVLQELGAGGAFLDRLLHQADELAAAPGLVLVLLQLAGQGQGLVLTVAVEKAADHAHDLVDLLGIVLEELPDVGLGLLGAAGGDQGAGVGLAVLGGAVGGGGDGLQDGDGLGGIAAGQQAAAVSQGDVAVGAVERVGALVPGEAVAFFLLQLAGVEEGLGGGLAVAQFGGQLAQLAEVLQLGLQHHHAAQRGHGVGLAPGADQRAHGGVVGLQRLVFLGLLGDLGEAQGLLHLGGMKAGQLLVSDGGLGGVADRGLAVEDLAQQHGRVLGAVERDAEVGGGLADGVVGGVVLQDAEKLLQGIGLLALLQVLLGFFQTFGDIGHGYVRARRRGGLRILWQAGAGSNRASTLS